MLELKFAIY